MTKSSYMKGALPFEFLAVPKAILRSAEYLALSHSARSLMNDLMGQYSGKNNGRLTPSFTAMESLGWVSKTTLQRAKDHLLDAPFVVLTRKGHAPRTAEWIGFTWWRLNYHESMDIDPRRFPYLNFMSPAVADPNTGRVAFPTGVLQKLDRKPSKLAHGGTESVPITFRRHASFVQ